MSGDLNTEQRRDVLSGIWADVWRQIEAFGSKYHDAAIEVETNTVRVWFAADPPASLAPVEAAAAARGTRIEFVRTPFDRDELRAASSAVGQALRARGVPWRTIAPTLPVSGIGTGLTIGIPTDDADQLAAAAAIAVEAAPGVPVVVITDHRSPIRALSGGVRRERLRDLDR